MCLIPRKNCDVPYNRKKIRWKFAYMENYDAEHIVAPYTDEKYAPIGKWMTARNLGPSMYHFVGKHNIGFHVFVNKCAAKKHGGLLLKVEVDEFVASGKFGYRQTETWKRMRILEISN